MQPDPSRNKWQELLRMLPWLAVAGVGNLAWKAWLRQETGTINTLLETDHVVGLQRNAEFFTECIGGIAFLCVGCYAWMLIVSLRTLRAGRWPSPTARVTRPTPVIGGWCLWLRFGIALLVATPAIFLVVQNTVQLVAMAWNTYADAQTKASAGMVRHAHAKPAPREPARGNDNPNG